MDQKYIDGLRQKYIKNPPEGMTADCQPKRPPVPYSAATL